MKTEIKQETNKPELILQNIEEYKKLTEFQKGFITGYMNIKLDSQSRKAV